MFTLSDEERAIVEVVADFVDREVRPAARDLEHAGGLEVGRIHGAAGYSTEVERHRI